MYLKRGICIQKSIAGVLALALLLFLACYLARDPSTKAKGIVNRSGIKGGLIVHHECGNGQLTAALKVDERFTVHGLDSDAGDVTAARDYFEQAGLDASVSVMQWGSSRLPYTDNLVNLFISDEADRIMEEEVLRVLVPGGIALIDGKELIKNRPPGMDEWNQTRYDHTNNGVSTDSVGSPRYLRWTAEPLYARSHEENSSTMAVVTSGGRIFYIQDEGPIGVSHHLFPSRWRLVARDAYNGKLLWKLDIPEWGWQVWETHHKQEIWTTLNAQRHAFPAGMARRLIARDDRVYMTLGYRAPVSVIDGAGGKIIRTLDHTEKTDEIVLVEDVLLTLQREIPARDRNRDDPAVNNPSVIQAVDPESGKILWKNTFGFVWQWSMVSDGERVFCFDADNERVCAMDIRTGNPVWQASLKKEKIESNQYIGMTFLVSGDKLFYMGPEHITAFDAATGENHWTMKGMGPRAPVSHNQPSLLVADGVLWPGGPSGSGNGDVMTGYDPATGEPLCTIEPGFLLNHGHHYRCFPPRATEQFLIMPRRGAEFIDLVGNRHARNDWMRGACRFGYVPANGLFYVTPHQCFCYTGVLVNGFNAFASDIQHPVMAEKDVSSRLIKGSAYNKALNAKGIKNEIEIWPMYRHDNARSGKTDVRVPGTFSRMWEAELGGGLKQAVVAGGKLYVTVGTKNRVVCLEPDGGDHIWQFTTNAEVDSPPTYHKGLLYFGCTDGWVYCLEAASGTLAWKYRVAPEIRWIMDKSRLQSAWPVHGSVIVLKDIVYAAAGRSSFLDGGIFLTGLDVFSGELLHSGHFEGPYPDLSKKEFNGYDMEGACNDLLVTDGEFLYLRQNKFDLSLNRIPVEPIDRDFRPPRESGKFKGIKGDRNVGLHLTATGGMLNETFFNRNFWIYSERWPGFYFANQAPKAGQLVTFDENNTYAVKHYPRRNTLSPMNIPGKDGYLVFADKNETPVNLFDGSEETMPVEWLPTPVKVLEGRRLIQEEDIFWPAVNFDKGPGFTRRTPPLWTQWHPTRFTAMSQAGNKLVLGGVPDEVPEEDPLAAFEGRLGSRIVILDKNNGKNLGVFSLDLVPVFDGISLDNDRVYLATKEGKLLCLGKE